MKDISLLIQQFDEELDREHPGVCSNLKKGKVSDIAEEQCAVTEDDLPA